MSSESKTTRKVSHQSSEADGSDAIYCFICDEELGGKLTKGAIMHMGLEDGEPICPEALNLTEKSKQKIKNIALTKHLDLKDKYEFLETVDLDLITSGDDLTSEDVLQKVEHFLDDIEAQKKKDEEQFDLLRAGAIDEIYAEFMNAEDTSLMTTSFNSESIIEAEEEEEEEAEEENVFDNTKNSNVAFQTVIPEPPRPPPPPPPSGKKLI